MGGWKWPLDTPRLGWARLWLQGSGQEECGRSQRPEGWGRGSAGPVPSPVSLLQPGLLGSCCQASLPSTWKLGPWVPERRVAQETLRWPLKCQVFVVRPDRHHRNARGPARPHSQFQREREALFNFQSRSRVRSATAF